MMLHLDLDCFFVSAHRVLDKRLDNMPVAVGGRSNLSIFDQEKAKRIISQNNGAFVSSILTSSSHKGFDEYFVDGNKKVRGIITTSSYEARKYGVKTAMSVNEALLRCPHLIVLPPNYPLYHELSYKLYGILKCEIPLIEQFSIDEFFGDTRGWVKERDILRFADYLKKKIYKELRLPVSIGISKSKWIAKLATEFAKPDGIKLVRDNEVGSFIENVPIEMFPGIGKGYQKRLLAYNIKTLGQLSRKKELLYSWKKPGSQLYNRVCGIDDEPIRLPSKKKSIGIGRTFDPVLDRYELKRMVAVLARHLSFLVLRAGINPNSYAIKIKYEYRIKSKKYININRLFNEVLFKKKMINLFDIADIHPMHKVIQLNLSVYNFQNNNVKTYDMFEYENDLRQYKLFSKVAELRNKFGVDIIKSGSEI